MFGFKRPLIAAHRGFSAQYPENTMASFEAAVQAGAHMIELDVTLSRDEEVVVIHDDTVDRTSDGSGPVRAFTLRELKQLDAGRWFQPRFSGEKIPALKEVLAAFKDRIWINIEIKPQDPLSNVPAGRIEEKVVGLVKAYQAENGVLISSFDPKMLMRVARISGELFLGLLVEDGSENKVPPLSLEFNGFSFHPQFCLLNPAVVVQCHARGVYVFAWDVRSKAQVDTCLRMDVDGVIVDDPLMVQLTCGA